MDERWEQVLSKLKLLKKTLYRSYKCLNKNTPIREETIFKHKNIIIQHFEEVRGIVNAYSNKFTPEHKAIAQGIFYYCRDHVLKISAKHNLHIKLPHSIGEKIEYNNQDTSEEENSDTQESENEIEEPEIRTTNTNMTQTVVEFLNTASKLIPDFDGRAENLQSFLDALNLVDSIKGNHDAVAVNLVKTKLKGTARNLISLEITLQEIITKLKNTVKGESTEVLTAKLMSVRQSNKNANAYAKEIEDLTKSLESAFISDGVQAHLACKYATQTAVKAITKNATNDKVKLIMESGNFSNMNEVMAKFVNSCTEVFGQPNSILYYNGDQRNGNQFRGRGRGYRRGRGNYNSNRGNNNGNYNNNYRVTGRSYANRGGNRTYNNSYQGHVRHITDDNSENEEVPLNTQQ